MNKQQPLRRGFLALGAGAVAGLVAAQRALSAAGPESLPQSGQAPAEQGKEMPKHEVRSGVVIAYEDQWFGPPWQDGEPIVLLHGVAESHVAWQQWIPVLSGQFRVLRPDLPGFGQSPLPATTAPPSRSRAT
ncbi:MAG: alpha/beta fold hydrolase [Rhodopila sp.]|jgi:pimeloyl-ACP methyl ester carboxylesterase